MKKIMFAVVAAMGMAAVADVTSANTVGYQTISVNAGTMVGMGVQFNDITTENTIAVTNLLTVAAPATATSAGSTADEIWLWDNANTTWVKYFYYKPARGAVVGWCKEGQTTATTDTLNNGDGFFFKRGGAATTVTLSGAVNTADASVEYTAAAGTMTYVSYPWPTTTPVKDALAVAAPATATSAGSTADEIWMWDSANTAWVKYFYYKPARGSVVGWCKEGQTTETTDTISAGQGFFFKRGGATTTITFNKPAGL